MKDITTFPDSRQVQSSARNYFDDLYETMDDGRIKAKNVSDLSTEDWDKIYKAVKKLGYDVKSGKDAKEIFGKYVAQNGFNREQSEAIKAAYSVSDNAKATHNPQRAELAKREYGTTTDFREAGYLLYDGTMLDFSGKKDGGPGGVRYMDHREIARVFGDEEVSTRYGDNTAYMNAFINEGNVRLMDSQGVTLGEIEPTEKQYTKLKSFVSHVLKNEGYFYLDLSNADGSTIESREYGEADTADRIIRDIKEYYKNGELPYRSNLQEFRYSARDTEGNTLSKAQQDYFRDSKVRDENGNLRVVYHGTDADFTVFKENEWAREKNGLTKVKGYFSENENYSRNYGNTKSYYLNITNPLDVSKTSWEKSLNDWRKWFATNGITDVTFDSAIAKDTLKGSQKNGTKLYTLYEIIDPADYWNGDGNVTEKISEAGYDGITWEEDGRAWMPFNAESIKTTDNTSPTENPDVRYMARTTNFDVYVDNVFDEFSKEDTVKFYEKIGEIKAGKKGAFRKAANGDYILEINNKLVYTDGRYNNPKITQVIEFNENNETILVDLRRFVYDTEKRNPKDIYATLQAIALAFDEPYSFVRIVKSDETNGRKNAARKRSNSSRNSAETSTRQREWHFGDDDSESRVKYSTRDYGYHAGDLGKSRSDNFGNQGSSRGTGHFGFGTYFVGNEEQINTGNYGKRQHEKVDFSKYKMFKPKNESQGRKLHDALRTINGGLDETIVKNVTSGAWSWNAYNRLRPYDILEEKFGEGNERFKEANRIAAYEQAFREYNLELPDSTEGKDEYYLYDLKDAYEEQIEKLKDEYDEFRDRYDDLCFMFGRDSVNKALLETLDTQNKLLSDGKTKSDYWKANVDSLSTTFMKALGYEGVDVRHIKALDNTGYGSVIYDLKGEDLARKKEIGTAQYSSRPNDTISNEELLSDAIRLVEEGHIRPSKDESNTLASLKDTVEILTTKKTIWSAS